MGLTSQILITIHSLSGEDEKSDTHPYSWSDAVGSINELISQLSDYYKLDDCLILSQSASNPLADLKENHLTYEYGKWMYEIISKDAHLKVEFDPMDPPFNSDEILRITLRFLSAKI